MEIALPSLREAFWAVKENKGCAGVDRVTVQRFEQNLVHNLLELQNEVYQGIYRPRPLMKVLIPKKDEDQYRALCIPSVRDRVVQKAVLNLVDPILDQEFEDESFAYRKGYSVKRAVYRIKQYYQHGYTWIINADIDDFFDTVDHDILMEKFSRFIDRKELQHLVRLWLKTEIWDGKTLAVPEKGLPQGSPISPVLANLFLDEIDERLAESGAKYIRYADNYLLLGKNKAEAEQCLALSEALLDRLDLDLEVEETASFKHGFRFLGVFFLDDLVMTPFACGREEIKKLQPVFPGPLDMAAWLCRP